VGKVDDPLDKTIGVEQTTIESIQNLIESSSVDQLEPAQQLDAIRSLLPEQTSGDAHTNSKLEPISAADVSKEPKIHILSLLATKNEQLPVSDASHLSDKNDNSHNESLDETGLVLGSLDQIDQVEIESDDKHQTKGNFQQTNETNRYQEYH
jgi:hypothetical protein